MSYELKLERARAVVVGHNEVLPEGEQQIDWCKFEKDLRSIGGTTDAALRQVSFEDLQAAGLPKLIARQVAGIFREGTDEGKELTHVSAKKAERMSPQELVQAYDPRDPDNPVGTRLRTLSKGLRFVVLSGDGSVHHEATAKLLAEVRDGNGDRETFAIGNRPHRTYRVGERPQQRSDENPLYRGRALRPDGTCDQTNRSWEGISDEVRTLLWLAVHETHELAIRSVDDSHRVLDLVVGDDKAAEKIRGRYQRASITYDELKAAGNLPTLKVSRGTTADRREDAFAGHRKY